MKESTEGGALMEVHVNTAGPESESGGLRWTQLTILGSELHGRL